MVNVLYVVYFIVHEYLLRPWLGVCMWVIYK